MARRRIPKQAVTYRLPQQILDRIEALAVDRDRTIAITVELLLDEGLTKAGYPPVEPTTDLLPPKKSARRSHP